MLEKTQQKTYMMAPLVKPDKAIGIASSLHLVGLTGSSAYALA